MKQKTYSKPAALTIKCLRVIKSCTTLQQLEVAQKYYHLAYRNFIRQGDLIDRTTTESWEYLFQMQDLLSRRMNELTNNVYKS
jgi:hypothetical protein